MYSVLIVGQVITTNPSFITSEYMTNPNGAVEIIFDVSQCSGGLFNYTGDDVYALTGVLTTASVDVHDWKHTPTLDDNLQKYKLTKIAGETYKYSLLITPNISKYYRITTNEVVTHLAFEFRNSDNSRKGKGPGSNEILVEIVKKGLNIKFNTPVGNQLTNLNSTVNFVVSSSILADLTLKINNNISQTATNAQTLIYSEPFESTGDYQCIAQATAEGVTVYDTLNIYVADNPVNASIPAEVNLGINYNDNDPTEATLMLYAKDNNNNLPDNIFVIGDFNNWSYSNDYQMKKDGTTGNWWLTLTNLVPQKEYAFQYVVKTGNDVVKITDAYCQKVLDPWNDLYISASIYPDLKQYPAGKTDGLVSVLQTQQSAFRWSQETMNFKKPDKNNLVIYELWVHDYSTYRSINEVINRLDYLQALGVNAIELMPITEFDGNINWGYNPNHFFAPDKAYGSEDAYKTLIDECHQRGIAVILDMVFNHATGINPFAKLYWDNAIGKVADNNPWFNIDVPHSNDVFNIFNHDFEGTRNYFKRVLEFWLYEYHIDGFRMNLTQDFCGDNCDNHIAIINDYYNDVKAIVPDVYFILEHWDSDEEQDFVDNGMLCWRNTNNAYSQTAMGWLKDGDSFTPANQKGWISYAGSHEEERNFYKAKMWGNGDMLTDETIRLNRVPMNLAFNILLQGPKMIWQFDEMGYDFSINLCEKGMISESGECSTSPKPVPDELDWFSNNLRMNVFNKVAQIVNLRTIIRPEVFTNGTITANIDSGVSLRTILWEYNGTKIIALGNFNVSGETATTFIGSKTYILPAGTWYNYLDGNFTQVGDITITLMPGELRIYTNDNSIVVPAPQEFDYTSDNEHISADMSDIYIYPTLVDNKIFIQSDDSIRNVQILAVRGGAVRIYNGNITEINVADLPLGVYLVVVTTDKKQHAQKILKQ
ncbi:MAG: alpha-amylase family glycosyl hydrolase [Paludibacter sp.]|nr:alpha-amylase family glycosyl hydrolase [Paludibacter sp.]